MGLSLRVRRAVFVYEAARIAAEAAKAPIVPETWTRREAPFQAQFIEVVERQCGPARKTSAKELHDDWVRAYEAMGWWVGPQRDTNAKTHPDMIPYEKLDLLEQDKDSVFIALCEIARQWIRE